MHIYKYLHMRMCICIFAHVSGCTVCLLVSNLVSKRVVTCVRQNVLPKAKHPTSA